MALLGGGGGGDDECGLEIRETKAAAEQPCCWWWCIQHAAQVYYEGFMMMGECAQREGRWIYEKCKFTDGEHRDWKDNYTANKLKSRFSWC